jgi:hypothetical protein
MNPLMIFTAGLLALVSIGAAAQVQSGVQPLTSGVQPRQSGLAGGAHAPAIAPPAQVPPPAASQPNAVMQTVPQSAAPALPAPHAATLP